MSEHLIVGLCDKTKDINVFFFSSTFTIRWFGEKKNLFMFINTSSYWSNTPMWRNIGYYIMMKHGFVKIGHTSLNHNIFLNEIANVFG